MLADGGTYCLLNAVLSVRCQQVLCLSGHCQASSCCSPEFQYFIFAHAAVFNPSASFSALGVCSETRSHLLLSWCQNFKSAAMEPPLHGEDSCSLAPPPGPGPEHRAQQPLTGPLAFSPRIWLEVWNWADSWYTLPGQPLCLGVHCFCPNHIWFLSKSVSVHKTRPGAFGCTHSWNTSYE